MITGFNTDIEFQGKTYHVQTEDKGLARPVIMSLIYDRGTILASKRSPYDDLIENAAVNEEILAERLNKQHRLICAAVRAGRIDDLIRMNQTASQTAQAAAKDPARKFEAVGTADPVVLPVVEEDILPIPKPAAGDDLAAILKPIDLDLDAYAILDEEILLPDEAVEIVSEMMGRERPVNNKLTIELLGDSRFRGGEYRAVTLMVCRGTHRKVIGEAQVMVKVLGSSFRPMIFHARTDSNGLATVKIQFPTFSEGRAALLVRAIAEGEEVELRRPVTHGIDRRAG